MKKVFPIIDDAKDGEIDLVFKSFGEQDDDDDLRKGLALERKNEKAVRENTDEAKWHCKSAIVWDVMGREQRRREWGIDPSQDIKICTFCDNALGETKIVVSPCGCFGGCSDCYNKAKNKKSRICPHEDCGKKLKSLITMKPGGFKTKSREKLEAESYSKSLDELVARTPTNRQEDLLPQHNQRSQILSRLDQSRGKKTLRQTGEIKWSIKQSLQNGKGSLISASTSKLPQIIPKNCKLKLH